MAAQNLQNGRPSQYSIEVAAQARRRFHRHLAAQQIQSWRQKRQTPKIRRMVFALAARGRR
jgi:hypothetical protein